LYVTYAVAKVHWTQQVLHIASWHGQLLVCAVHDLASILTGQRLQANNECAHVADNSAVEGLTLDEESELELALFLSLEEKDRADRQAAAAAAASHSGTNASEAAAPAASAAAAVAAAVAQAETSAAGALAAATAQVDAAAKLAGAAVNAQVTAVQSTVNDVMGQVEAVLKSLPGYTGPLVTRQAEAQEWTSIQQEEAELRQAVNQVGANGGAAGEDVIPNVHDEDRAGAFDSLPDSRHLAMPHGEPVSPNSLPSELSSAQAVATAAAARMHSFSSDDSSFDFTEAPSAPQLRGIPALPTEQFAALSLLDADNALPGSSFPLAEASVSHLDMLDSTVEYLPEEESDSPFFASNESPFVIDSEKADPAAAGAAGPSYVSEEAGANDATWCRVFNTAVTAGVDSAAAVGDQHVPISYPQVDRSNLTSSSEGPSSPIHYPSVERPTLNPAAEEFTPAGLVHDPSDPPTPRTQMHNMALGSDLFNGHSFMTANEAGESEDVLSDVPPSEWHVPADEGVGGPASIHVHPGRPCRTAAPSA